MPSISTNTGALNAFNPKALGNISKEFVSVNNAVDVNVQIDGRIKGKDIVFAHTQTLKSQRRAT